MRILLPLVGLAVVVLLALTPAAAASRTVFFADEAREAQPFQMIVNPAVPTAVVDRKFFQDAFLKKVTRWPDGTPLHPADLTPGSPVRQRFSEEILDRSVEAVRNYWQQRIFAGRDVPPPELNSEDEAVAYVLKHEGGVAYVSSGMKVNGAKVVAWR